MPRPPVINPRDYRSPVVVFLNAIGDSILALPALRALAKVFPHRITLVCDDHPYRFIFGELPLANVVGVPNRAAKSFDWEEVAARIPACDLLIGLITWHSLDMDELLRRLRPRVSVGFMAGYDIVVRPDLTRHVAELMLDAVRVLWRDVALAPHLGPPRFSPAALREVEGIRQSLPARSKLLAVHSETQVWKRWPVDDCCRTLRLFVDRHPDYWCYVTDLAADVATECAHSRVVHGDLSLEAMQCLVGGADLFVGIDSCSLHVADFSGVPSVGLFGPTRPERWGFVRAPHRTLRAAENRIADITSSDVVGALEELIANCTCVPAV
jgi:ADP-heptose:LPS heptosyltransferase